MKKILIFLLKFFVAFFLVLIGFYFYVKSDWNRSIPKEKIIEIKTEANKYPEIPQRFLLIYNQFNKSVSVNKYVFNQLISINLSQESPSLNIVWFSFSPERTKSFTNNVYVKALKIEREMSYSECLKLLLNKYDFLNGQIGVFDASKFYFNKELNELEGREMAILALMTRNPSIYNPKKINRLKLIKQKLNEHGY